MLCLVLRNATLTPILLPLLPSPSFCRPQLLLSEYLHQTA